MPWLVLDSRQLLSPEGKKQQQQQHLLNNIKASSWTQTIALNLVAKASDNGETLDAKQIDFNSSDTFGSVIQGGKGNDKLYGKAGWDILDGDAGNDLIHAGNGRDIITGGTGADELWGDFGWNTYKSEKDDSSDLIAIKSDQFLVNWMYVQAGNNPNSEKEDIIEGLDSNDQIRIVGAATADLTFAAGANAHGVSGIGIYAKGALEAVYTGGDLSVAQIQGMTTGDASAAAMSNSIDNYGWTQHP
jgi:Ca2+-binding RTX toxin-like protein